ncbi:protein phosphatase 2C 16-like [Andrographis paniculata]|uniref:protein phosphatase 2C 16-like n=1 Tax=Andrographis paniculata TaxID=175694 RepID=UPI0021E83C68|nr:protein phosphatase 2C 16-like [Andrographis paniculata]
MIIPQAKNNDSSDGLWDILMNKENQQANNIILVRLRSCSMANPESNKTPMKKVFESDCLPRWGTVSVCGLRPEMEDVVTAEPHFMKIPSKMLIGDHGTDGVGETLSHLTSHFFGVYDGHGGDQVAKYCGERVHLALADELRNVIEDFQVNGNDMESWKAQWEEVFKRCFTTVDDEVGGKACRITSTSTFGPVAPETVGSTAVVAVLCSSHIIVANCGDSRAVLYRGKEAIPLSVDHKPNREDENARIESSGGIVIGHRVFGILAISRSIGDWCLKPWIIPEPEVMIMDRSREDECLVMASDGLWDVLTNEEACEVARKRLLVWHKKNGTKSNGQRGQAVDPAAQEAAEYLANLAFQRGREDNISIVVVDLKAQRKFKSKA